MTREIKHIFLITIDALRADHVGYIGKKMLTPNIDKLSKNGTIFTRAFANGPGTNQSFPSILTSSYFLMHDGYFLSKKYETVAEALHKKGYQTCAFHSNPFLSSNFGWSRGFNEFHDFMDKIQSPSAFITQRNKKNKLEMNSLARSRNFLGKISKIDFVNNSFKKIFYRFNECSVPYIESKELNQHIFKWLDDHSHQKFFLWIHYMDPHFPYIPPEEFSKINRKSAFAFNNSINLKHPSTNDLHILRKLYEGEVRYVDNSLGSLLTKVKEKLLCENSIIIILSDHGESFMEHNKYGHTPEIMYNDVLHVPLIIDGLDKPERITRNTQLLDLAPTIIDVLNIRKPESFLGKSFFDRNSSAYPIFSESAENNLINLTYNKQRVAVSCIYDKWKLIVNNLTREKKLYNIEKDFHEYNNVIKEKPKLYAYMKKLLSNHMKKMKF